MVIPQSRIGSDSVRRVSRGSPRGRTYGSRVRCLLAVYLIVIVRCPRVSTKISRGVSVAFPLDPAGAAFGCWLPLSLATEHPVQSSLGKSYLFRIKQLNTQERRAQTAVPNALTRYSDFDL